MPATGTAAMKSIAERLRAILEREPALRGGELVQLVEEKERLVAELEQGLKLAEPGAAGRVAELEALMAPLTFANGLTIKFNRILLQLSRLRKPEAKAAPAQRLDLIS